MHHITFDRLRDNLSHMDKASAAGIDGYTVAEVIEHVDWLAKEVLRKILPKGIIRRPFGAWIPKPGKAERRPIGNPYHF